MKVRLPPNGGTMSLDALVELAVSHETAREALLGALRIAPLGPLLVRYLGLHRPAQRDLSWDRVSTLLNELLPEIHAQRFQRDGQSYEAPADCWAYGLQQILDMRDNGKLKLPLKGHGLLREIMTSWQPASAATAGTGLVPNGGPSFPRQKPQPPSKTLDAVSVLLSRGQDKP